MPETIIGVDLRKPPTDQPVPVHNRWHPEIPPVASVRPGAVFRVECLDWTGGQIQNSDSANDVRDVDLTQVHYLAGPIHVEGAEPGDLLVVDILDIGTLPDMEWGFSGIFARENGGGFLTDFFPEARKAIWDFEGIYATSRHVPGVRFAGIAHPGLIGVAPSQALLDEWNRREQALIAKNPERVPPVAQPPNPHGAVLGTLKGAHAERVAKEAARTIPGRENGGNCDIKNLSRGSRVFFPVYVKGANLSMGDLHFSQGDGEITFCGAIEMAGWLDIHVDLIKDGVARYGVANPIFMPGPVEPRYSRYLAFQGVSVDESGRQHYLDATVAYRRACLNAIEYFQRFGYTGEQVYMVLGTAPVEGRSSGIVDIPNAVCTLYVPTEIFTMDVIPSGDGPTVVDRGNVAVTT